MSVGEVNKHEIALRLRVQTKINDPFLGAVTPAEVEASSILWPGSHWTRIEQMGVTEDGSRRFEEYMFTPNDPGKPELPVGIMFESGDDGLSQARIYSDHHLVEDRKPILPLAESLHPGKTSDDILIKYFEVLGKNDLEAVLDCFEPDAYFRHSNGETFWGIEEIRQDYIKMMGSVGIRIGYCTATDDGTTCVVECYMPSGRPAVAVYQRSARERLAAVRIYL